MARKDLVDHYTPIAPIESLGEQLQRALSERYVIRGEIGRGGTSIVFLADDRQTSSTVAIKVLRPEFISSIASARFLRETEILRRLDHINIVPFREAGARDGFLFYTMPYVSGATLRDRLQREKPLPLDDVLSIARQVAQALVHAHERQIVHRDIKPANILLDKGRVMVADFGIARAINIASGDTMTSSNIAVGTPEYMSPEQANGGRELDARSDIYSLGCVMYEMIAGSPPFTGETAASIIARHRHTVPHSVRVVRPSVPVSLERLLMKTLEKVPADRFPNAAEFLTALDAIDLADSRDEPPSGLRRRRVLTVAALATAAAATGWWVVSHRSPPLDTRRIVVFPPVDQGTAASEGSSEEVATYIGYALGETRPLRWLEAWDLTDDPDHTLARTSPARARRISMDARAGYYIDGTILRQRDSATVVLRLHSVAGDSVVHVAGASGGANAYLPQIALRAVAELLPAILQPGATVDLRSLSERSTTAIANFLQGEREYRRMQFPAALDHYRAAVTEDSAFAIAAFKGAQTAMWLSRPGIDTVLVQAALRYQHFLTPPQVLLASGLGAYVTGKPDSAIVYLRAAVRADSTLPGAWALLGEVYARSLATEPDGDSLARDALRKARMMDRSFAPTLALLEDMALRDGNIVEARQLKADLRLAGADTTHGLERALVWKCIEEGPRSVDWVSAARREVSSVLDAGRLLARGGRRMACARTALRAVLESDSATRAYRGGALLLLNGVLFSGGRVDELRQLVLAAAARGLPVWELEMEDAALAGGLDPHVAAKRDSIGTDYAHMVSPTLWFLGTWATRRGAAAELREIEHAARVRSDSTGSRADRLIARALEARLTLVNGDTATAITQLRALRPTGARRDIAWRQWEGLAAERLLLSEVLFQKRQYREAIQTASLLDATEPVPYVLYLRPSLELRVRAATAARDRASAALYQARLERLAQ